LLLFYRARLAVEASDNVLEKLLVIGRDFVPEKLKEIANEALGRALNILRPEDVGLILPSRDLSFDDLAAPAGLATYGWK
jgi:hypothetical protein